METLLGQGRGRGRGGGRGRAQRYAHLPDIEAPVEPKGPQGYADNIPLVLQPRPAAAPNIHKLEFIRQLQRQLDDQSQLIAQLAINGAGAPRPEDHPLIDLL